jgi:hypothetical protein
MYTLIVGNIGTIGKYDTLKVAKYQYVTYVNLSAIGYGKVAGESVYLFENDEIIEEHMGTNDDRDEE